MASKYFSATARWQRTFLVVLFLYAFLNGSKYNLVYGVGALGSYIVRNADMFWSAISVATLALVMLFIGVFMVRRWKLARSNTDLTILSALTLGVAGLLVVGVLVAGKVFTTAGHFDTLTYWTLFKWLWQIPVGYFVGTGLSWAIKDRQIAGVFTTQTVDEIDGLHHKDDPAPAPEQTHS